VLVSVCRLWVVLLWVMLLFLGSCVGGLVCCVGGFLLC